MRRPRLDHPFSLMPSDPGSPSATSPDALIARCLMGDETAWEQIVARYWRNVFNVA